VLLFIEEAIEAPLSIEEAIEKDAKAIRRQKNAKVFFTKTFFIRACSENGSLV